MTVNQLNNLLEFTENIVLTMAEREAVHGPRKKLWNRADHIFHLACWMDYSRQQINADMQGGDAPDKGDIAQVNQAFYEEHAEKPLSQAVDFFKKNVKAQGDYLSQFTPEDLLREDLPHQFIKPLYWHLAVDAFTHPMQHVLYYYLIHKDVPALLDFIHAMDRTIMDYGQGKPGVFHLGEFFDYQEELLKQKIQELGFSEKQLAEDRALGHFLSANGFSN